MATKEQRRRRRRTPIAASADRSQKERDRFFGGSWATSGSGSPSKPGRFRRPVGKDIRSKAAKAAGTGNAIEATPRPSEVAEADALDRISDNLTEQNVGSPEPLPEAPVENITDSLISPVVQRAIDAGGVKLGTTDGAQVVDTGVPLEDTELVVKSVTEPPKDPLSDAKSVYEGLQDPVDEITENYVNYNQTPVTPGADTPGPDRITQEYLMGRTPSTPGVDEPLPEGDPLTLKYLRGEDIATPGVDGVPLPDQPLSQSYKGQGMGGATALPPMEKPKGILAQLMQKYPKATAAWQEDAERRANEAFWEDPTAAKREQEERKYFPDPHKGYEPTAGEQKAAKKAAKKAARKSQKRWKKAGRGLRRMGIID
jgi:hypothetical protein